MSALIYGAGNVPFHLGQLQDDLNAGGHNITNVASLTDTNGNPLGAGYENIDFTNVVSVAGEPLGAGWTYVLGQDTNSASGVVTKDNADASYDPQGAASDVQTFAAGQLALMLQKNDNLGSLANVATARTNLGLGSAATSSITTFAQAANNGSDFPNKATTAQNLGVPFNKITAISTNSTVALADRGTVFNTTTGTNTITFTNPTATNGMNWFVRKTDSGAGVVTVNGSAIPTQGWMEEIISDGTSFFNKAIIGTLDSLGNWSATEASGLNFNFVTSGGGALQANGVAVLTSAGTASIASGKTITISDTLTLAGTDGSTLNVGSGGTLGSLAFVTPGTGISAALALNANANNGIPLLGSTGLLPVSEGGTGIGGFTTGQIITMGSSAFTGITPGTGVATAMANATGSSGGFQTQTQADGRYMQPGATTTVSGAYTFTGSGYYSSAASDITQTGTTLTNTSLSLTLPAGTYLFQASLFANTASTTGGVNAQLQMGASDYAAVSGLQGRGTAVNTLTPQANAQGFGASAYIAIINLDAPTTYGVCENSGIIVVNAPTTYTVQLDQRTALDASNPAILKKGSFIYAVRLR